VETYLSNRQIAVSGSKRSVRSISKCWKNGFDGVQRERDRRSMFLRGRSLQQSDANLTSVEVYVSVISTLKHQRCRNLCF